MYFGNLVSVNVYGLILVWLLNWYIKKEKNWFFFDLYYKYRVELSINGIIKLKLFFSLLKINKRILMVIYLRFLYVFFFFLCIVFVLIVESFGDNVENKNEDDDCFLWSWCGCGSFYR